MKKCLPNTMVKDSPDFTLMFEHKEEYILLDNVRILQLIRRMLSYIDERLVDHGERVAYLACEIIKDTPYAASFNKETLFILALLHDIGAYKTEEIDNMVMFETESVFDHAVYGYLLLKYITPLGKMATAILHHHTPYESQANKTGIYERYAQLLYLADRVDILYLTKVDNLNAVIESQSGISFAPDFVSLFLSKNRDGKIIEKLRSEEFMEKTQVTLQSIVFSQLDLVRYLSLIIFVIDFRSSYTATHTVQTTGISAQLGKLLALPNERLFEVTTGAFLHDLGKVSTPINILEKPGKLSDEEMEIMRHHVVMSGEILSDLVPDKICRIAARHHEKIDGTGYPDGLRGENMTLEERIVAVADIVSALSGRRSYKDQFPDSHIQAILKQMRDDGKIDVTVVNTLLAHYDEVKAEVTAESDRVQKLYDTIQDDYAELRS